MTPVFVPVSRGQALYAVLDQMFVPGAARVEVETGGRSPGPQFDVEAVNSNHVNVAFTESRSHRL
jgi:hypothetical protein